jgi:mono/diheme cytochrome c family protein
MQKPGRRIGILQSVHLRSFALALAILGVCFAGCAQEEYPTDLWMRQHPMHDAGSGADAGGFDFDAAAPPQVRGLCKRANAQGIPARLVSMSAKASAGNDLIYVTDLFERFKAVCGNCHGPAVDPPGLGSYQIRSANDFLTKMTPPVLQHVKSDGPTDPANPATDPNDPMPPFSSPTGGPYSKRPPTDPVKQFADLVAAWLGAGSPQSFAPKSTSAPGADGDASTSANATAYLMTPFAGNAMTNIGYCVPDKTMVAVEQDKSLKLDAMFASLTKAKPGPGVSSAQMIGLPEHLAETDLFTLDTAELAQYGVIAFQPTYPLWSDDAGKLRYVRVPRGKSIVFNKDTQEFTIPANTRFYKTFLKKIVDTDGSYRFRKIETRLIVSRPDQLNADGTSTVTALFGSYQWNANETEATLIETPRRDGLPFSDTLLQYTTDEQLASAILATKPLLPLEALLEGGATRHYAVPSSERCIQCHMGSNSASFILGFRPIEIQRRGPGESGTLAEPGQKAPGPDELTQLQRLIDYGIITGINSPDEVLPLERSEGSRAPRNDFELLAQGYMIGNCAHCHNPRGFPSVTNPVLKDILNVLPGPDGGIFQFPLERYSPRIGRGPGEGELIPYITPSLMDQPSGDWNVAGQGAFLDRWNLSIATNGGGSKAADGGGSDVNFILYAPWRSLIFRNVQTPFAYEDNLALFPHMPMNTPGFDCRAKQIMSDWMVSIPSARKAPEKPEYAFANSPRVFTGGATLDDNPQPYVEVMPAAPGYDAAKQAAETRLKILHTGVNPAIPSASTYSVYNSCPDTSDILDPAVTLDPVCHSTPSLNYDPPLAGTPVRAHWVNTDLTQAPNAPGTFSVRRPDWPTVVAQQTFPKAEATCGQDQAVAANAQAEVKKAVRLLQDVKLDDAFRTYATTDVPFGMWEKKPGCKYASVPTASTLTGDKKPLWMNHVSPAASDPVYMASPGAAIFGMICVNCHGPNVDSHGRLSDNLATMTGGNAIVANFRDGFFGPLDSPGLHRQEAFATSLLPAGLGPNWTDASVDDRAARYLSWMALGGTEVQIPGAILNIVADTRVLGVHRTLPTGVSANMLSTAKTICLGFLKPDGILTAAGGVTYDWTKGWFVADAGNDHLTHLPLLIANNGDAELWLKLCSVNNPPPVRVVPRSGPAQVLIDPDPKIYGTGHVGDQRPFDPTRIGSLTRYTPDEPNPNLFPWCAGTDLSQADSTVPACPFPADTETACGAKCWTDDRKDEWATRGAINAGLAVYTYVDGLVKDLAKGSPPKPTYDQCDRLH